MHLLEVNIPEINFKSQFSIHGISNSHSSVIAKKTPPTNLWLQCFFSFWLIKSWLGGLSQYVHNGKFKRGIISLLKLVFLCNCLINWQHGNL